MSGQIHVMIGQIRSATLPAKGEWSVICHLFVINYEIDMQFVSESFIDGL